MRDIPLRQMNRRYNRRYKSMELQKIIGTFCYRVEPKPEGGFIARCSDPSQQSIEGPTRMEVEQKIRERISSELASNFPQLKDVFDPHTIQHTYHIETKPGGGFLVQSDDPARGNIEASTRERLEDLVVSKFVSHLIEKLPPDAVQQFSTQVGGGSVKLTVNRKVTFSPRDASGAMPSQVPGATPSGGSFVETNEFPPSSPPVVLGNDPSPVTRYESSGFGTGFVIPLLVLAVIAITYFFLHHR